MVLALSAVLMLPALTVPGQSTGGGAPGNQDVGKPAPEKLPPHPSGQPSEPAPEPPPAVPDLPQYPISHVEVRYLRDHLKQPAIG